MTHSLPASNNSDASTQAEPVCPHVVLQPIAREQATVLQNLFELYAHDFSEHVPLELNALGRFEVSVSDLWWTDGHYPFFIRCADQLCGFALVRRGSKFTGVTDIMDVAEFFVVRGARHKRVGSTVAHAIFAAFPGAWEIRVRQTNALALRFWSRAVATWLGRAVPSSQVSFEGVDWDVLRFETQAQTKQDHPRPIGQ